MYLLDTNVPSEVVKPRPDPGVARWLDHVNEHDTFLSVVSIAEFRFGIERLPLGHKRRQREAWLAQTIDRFAERIVPFDLNLANTVGRLMARTEAIGRPIRGNDAIIAATALQRHLVVVTRNVKHFNHTEVEVLNPWERPSE